MFSILLFSEKVFDSFANTKSYPTLKFKLTGQKLSVQLEDDSSSGSTDQLTVPFGLLDNKGRHFTLVHNGSTIESKIEGQTVLANPNTTGLFRSLYDVSYSITYTLSTLNNFGSSVKFLLQLLFCRLKTTTVWQTAPWTLLVVNLPKRLSPKPSTTFVGLILTTNLVLMATKPNGNNSSRS